MRAGLQIKSGETVCSLAEKRSNISGWMPFGAALSTPMRVPMQKNLKAAKSPAEPLTRKYFLSLNLFRALVLAYPRLT
jgi:hypothetical protein